MVVARGNDRYQRVFHGAVTIIRRPAQPAPDTTHRASQTCFEIGLSSKAKAILGSAGFQLTAWLSVGLARVPDDLSLEGCEPGNQVREVLDADFRSRPEVNRLTVEGSLC